MAEEFANDSVTKLCEFLTQIRVGTSTDTATRVLALMPCLDSVGPIPWAEMARATFDDHPGLSAADKLRLIIKKTG